ncbi:MAG: NADPH:quinone oxidoreductase family protein [Gammaproteobacteria bacterium]|nr:NADPH:quinone oxidoreductase family protein [Gammaproteobacteria bacterium]
MQALICEAFGPLENLRLGEIPPPALGDDQVRIDVHACGVNFPDVLIVQGLYQVKPEPPFSPGCEVAGVVAEVADGVGVFRPGDRVLAWLGFGGCAEQAVAHVGNVHPLPASMDFATASVLLLTYGTAYHALVQRAALQVGESVAVLGAGGGVGLACVELAKALGARVIACASNAEKLAVAREHGADAVVNYSEENLRGALKAYTDGKGVDVICDPVGGELAEPAFRAIAWQGRFLVIGFAAGEIPRLPLNLALLKGASIVGVFLGEFNKRDPQANRRNIEALMTLFEAQKISPLISQTFTLRDSLTALQVLRNREALGKLVVRVREGA